MDKFTKDSYDEIYKLIKETHEKIADSSCRIYSLNVRKILADLNDNGTVFLNYDNMYKYFFDGDASLPTIRNKINSVIIFLKGIKADKDIIEKYSLLSDGMGTKIAREKFKMEKTEKEKDNWTSVESLSRRIVDLYNDVPYEIKTNLDMYRYQQYIAGLLQLNTGLRNELADCEIYPYGIYAGITTQSDVNYLIFKKGDKTSRLVIQNYKTKKTYGIIDIVLDEEITREVKKYYVAIQKYKDAKKFLNNWLFFNKHGNKLSRVDYTKFMKDVFNIGGKQISTSMIRKIKLSEKYSANDMEDTAKKMGHSMITQLKHYIKKL